MRRFVTYLGLLPALLLTACGAGESGGDGGDDGTLDRLSPSAQVLTSPGTLTGSPPTAAGITVTSDAFSADGQIPVKYTCRGQNLAPPLAWHGVPAGTAALALVMDDPDAVGGLYIHWVVSDIPADTTGSAEGSAPQGGRVGANSGGDQRYLGPCPPAGTGVHHYRFTLYALPKRLDLAASTPARQAVDAISGAATARGQLVGTSAG